MSKFKEPTFAERQGAAARAKKAALETFRASVSAQTPSYQPASEARAIRASLRKEARIANQAELAQKKLDVAEAKLAEEELAAREHSRRATTLKGRESRP